MTAKYQLTKNPPLLLPNPTIPLRRYSVVPQHGGAVIFPICPFVDRLCDRPALAQPDSARAPLPGNLDQPAQAAGVGRRQHNPHRGRSSGPRLGNRLRGRLESHLGLFRDDVDGVRILVMDRVPAPNEVSEFVKNESFCLFY
jgi:hypothetical protein